MFKKLLLYLFPVLIAGEAFALVFEKDKRLDFYEIQNPSIQELAKSVFTFIPKANLTKRSDGQFEFSNRTALKDAVGLCPGEPFAEQFSVGTRCSGFLIESGLGVTAGHCVSPVAVKNFCENYYIIFDHRMTSQNQTQIILSENSVHECIKPAKLVFDPNSSSDDYAVLKFSKLVKDRKPLKYRKSGKIADSEKIFMLGFPRGLPQKISPDRNVLGNGDPSFFSTNLDCFHGNSGSPVFNAKTLDVEGIFVRGQGDIPNNNSADPRIIGDFTFDETQKCHRTLVCKKSEGCTATMDANRITRIKF